MIDQSVTLFSSDNDCYKTSGNLLTASLTFSGVVAGDGTQTQTVTLPVVDLADYVQLVYDNSSYHSGKYKNIAEYPDTAVPETTFGFEALATITYRVLLNGIEIVGSLYNPDISPITLTSTTLNFVYIPYEATI